ncbi:putative vacuolar protein sorting-associated protein 13B [Cucumis melo var. makuwa]|uniref:Putative vacuolar protein sorting-associated protein 13B n=1 Tax=Cucumis melo var. makuwa TaxID=1194695 RepID=A0A5D3E479_CUCMM|nr:putative vacuolar protein sorting-associated protein 13B [Cucumis melo var. makuwa]
MLSRTSKWGGPAKSPVESRVGRLSIKIPWKKLGWDPIIIILEDIYISASQRDDGEWSSDAVEKREFAGKKAKIAAAELAKLSRRVCGRGGGSPLLLDFSCNSFFTLLLDPLLEVRQSLIWSGG